MSLSITTPPAPDLSGRALDRRYELHVLIGEGAFGRVYRGRDRRLARAVAVKVIKPWWAEDPSWVRSFEREAQLMASVSDPGIVQIFDVGYAEEGLYYVAELIEGESVAARLRRGPLAPSQAREIAEQLARALAPAHDRRIVHRDIKPANVLISAGGRVKITDFGVARLLGASSERIVGTVVGTPCYMAPEQARGGGASPASDVYSIGVVLHEMLAGRPPFVGGSAVELALRHLQDPPPPLPPTAPAALAAVVERALAKDPDARYRSGAELAEALARTSQSATPAPAPARRAATPAPARRAATPAPARPPGAPPRAPATPVPARTLIAPWTSPRRNVNPAARRRTVAAFSVVLLVLLGMVGAAVRFGRARPVPRVRVPRIIGFSSGDARSMLAQLGLHALVAEVPAPGASAGAVTAQVPSAGVKLARGSTVSLSIAQAPRWRVLISFSDAAGRASPPFRIRGTHWRIVYRMSYTGTCTFIFICSGPSAQVANLARGTTVSTFDLSEGSNQIRTFDSGPAVYQVRITPGDDSTRWSAQVQDYY